MARRPVASALLCCALALSPGGVAAQDLFELEVLSADTTPPGDMDVEVHTNGMTRGGVVADSLSARHRPVHVSFEIARGWTSRVDTAVFIQTAPLGPAGSARFAGGHLKAKVRLAELLAIPLRVAVSAEYAFNRMAFDDELQTLEIRPILDYSQGRLSIIANPSLEIVTRGSDEGLEPLFDVSAKAAWQLTSHVSLETEYFSAAATTRHLQPDIEAHHLLFGGVAVNLGPAWELALGTGRCVSRSEPWLVKSVFGYRF